MRARWPRKWLKLASVETIALEQLKRSTTSRERKEEMDDNLETKGNWLPNDLLFKVALATSESNFEPSRESLDLPIQNSKPSSEDLKTYEFMTSCEKE
ncbi:hypothetical protein RND71_034910 [Anisodus tanguticus]|uniref:Uncharacterized protein n=1 Tax=Anisodus tanguticus TaxID=243964 RepID=A0AAE1R4P0_9SOLA|nr:hypothetical protein RND71_034910 [Anisodus tanguticus]